MSNDVTFTIRAQDEASATITKVSAQLNTAMNETKASIGGATTAINQHDVASQGLVNLIKNERQELRMRTFAFREGAGAVDQLSQTFVGPSGLQSAIMGGVANVGQMEFAIKALGAAAGGMGGALGAVGALVGTLAIPIAVVGGAVMLLKGHFNELDAELLKNRADFNATTLSLAGLTDVQKAVVEASTKVKAAENLEPELGIIGEFKQTWGDILGFQWASEEVENAQLKVVIERVKAHTELNEAIKKELDQHLIDITSLQERTQVSLAYRESELSVIEAEKGREATLRSRLALGKEEIKTLQDEYGWYKARADGEVQSLRTSGQTKAADDAQIAAAEKLYAIDTLINQKKSENIGLSKEIANSGMAWAKVEADLGTAAAKANNEAAGAVLLSAQSNAVKRLEIEKNTAAMSIQLDEAKDLSLEQDENKRTLIADKYNALILKSNAEYDDKIVQGHRQAQDKVNELLRGAQSEYEKMLGQEVVDESDSEEEKVRAQEAASKKRLENARDEAMAKAMAADASAKDIGTIENIYNNAIAKLEAGFKAKLLDVFQKDAKKSFLATAEIAKSAISTIEQFAQQKSEAEINGLENEKQAADDRFDAEIAAAQGNAAVQAQLQAAKAASDAQYDAQVKAAKVEEFEGEKQAKTIEAIINTAEEITKVLATPWMIPIVAGLGAAQIALIEGQPTPNFASGTGPEGFDVPPGYPRDNFKIGVSSGERVTVTPAGQLRNESSTTVKYGDTHNSQTVHVHIHVSAPMSDGRKIIKQALIELKRKTGLTLEQLTEDQRARITL